MVTRPLRVYLAILIDTTNMTALSRQEKEELILDLYYNKSKTYHEIAKEARISLRDIKGILDKGIQGAHGEQSMSESTKAYKLFSEGKSPLEVAITLNLREDKVTEFYKESWTLNQLYDLNQMYMEIKVDIAFIVKLYKLTRAVGMNIAHVVKLLRIANNDLPSVEYGYQTLIAEINSLKEQKSDLSNEVTKLSNEAEYYRASSQREKRELEGLRQEREKQEELVKKFQDTNKVSIKIRKIVEGIVHSTLSHAKVILKYGSLSLVESMKKSPDKYYSLIYNDIYSPMSSTSLYPSQYHAAFDTYGKDLQYPSPDYYSGGCLDMLVEEAEKVYNKLAKELIEESITDYAASTTSSLPSLPSPPDEK